MGKYEPERSRYGEETGNAYNDKNRSGFPTGPN